MMEERDDLRKQDTASPWLSRMNYEITKATSDHKRRQWREFVESIDHRNNSTKLWHTIKGIDGKSKQTAENEGMTFTGRPHTSPKMIANRQFTTSKLGKHSSSRRTRQVSKDVKRKTSLVILIPKPGRLVTRHLLQNILLTAQSMQIKSVISVPIKDFIHHYPRTLLNDIPRV